MDPVSHLVLGGSLGYVVFGRRLGRTAAAVGALAAFVPDADIFIRSARDPLLAIEYHRHFTHALAFAPLGAAAIAALWLVRPALRAHALALWACALLAYLSHTLLDAATSYGTQLLWPFSRARFGWDVVSILDPLVTLPLAAGLLWGVAKRQLRPPAVGLALAALYLSLGAFQHNRALTAQRQLAAARGHTPLRVEVMPTMANQFVWRALYVHAGRIYSDRIRVGWFSGATVRDGWSLPLATGVDLTPAQRARNRHRSFARFAWFSENWVARSPADPAVLGDMRYSLSGDAFDPIWGIRFNAPDAPADVTWVNHSRERAVSPRDLWRELTGRDPRFRPLP